MANGGFLDEKQFAELEAPLKSIDSILDRFAGENGLLIENNQKDWPSRSIAWDVNDVRCLIQIYLASEKLKTFNVWFCASRDTEGKRFWKHESPVKNELIEEFSENLPKLLEVGKSKLDSWCAKSSELKFATDLSNG